jgi:hypothetical protein
MRRALVVLVLWAAAPDAGPRGLWPAQILLWNLVGVLVIVGHPYAVRWWDHRRGRYEEPTRFLTWPACRKVVRHPELRWPTLKLIDQAEARRTIARLEAWQARNVAAVDAWSRGRPSHAPSGGRTRPLGPPGHQHA